MTKKMVALWAVAALVLTTAVGVGAFSTLRPSPPANESAPEDNGDVPDDTNASLADYNRPDCPAPTVPGANVELSCLSEDQPQAGHENAVAADQVTIINLWAWWCQPCREELPYLDSVAQQRPDWDIVGVHADSNAAYGAGLLDELDSDLVSYHDAHNDFASQLGLPGVIPITVVYVGDEQRGVFPTPFQSAQDIIDNVESVVP